MNPTSRQFVIPDTNIFVAAGFNHHSSSAKIIQLAKQSKLLFTWSQATFSETKFIIQKIPPLHWDNFSPLFKLEHKFTGTTQPNQFSIIKDPDDRKFVALAHATNHPIITNDDHLLSARTKLEISIQTPSEFISSTSY